MDRQGSLAHGIWLTWAIRHFGVPSNSRDDRKRTLDVQRRSALAARSAARGGTVLRGVVSAPACGRGDRPHTRVRPAGCAGAEPDRGAAPPDGRRVARTAATDARARDPGG